MSETKPQVTIYTAVWCGYCKMAMNYMDQKGIKYTKKDVEKEPDAAQEAVEKSGHMGVPVIDVAGTIILGFDRAGLDAAFKNHKLS
jgi:glutaredoxin 3